MKKSWTIFLSLLYASFAQAQSTTGSWFGSAEVDFLNGSSNYLLELTLKQKNQTVEGFFGYYFKDAYQSFRIKGTYNSGARELVIPNIPLYYYKSTTLNGVECPMNFRGVLTVSRVSSTLKGFFFSDAKYKYTCPTLRAQFHLDPQSDNTDSLLQYFLAEKKIWKNSNPPALAVTDQPAVVQPSKTEIPHPNPVQRTLTEPGPEESRLSESFRKRKNNYSADLELENDSVLISIYDNGNVDADSITVFLNQRPILIKKELTLRAINLYLGLDTTLSMSELGIFAENLGLYPPNTAIMVVMDGTKRHEVFLSSSLESNACVRLRRKKSNRSAIVQ
jgi:hypothetical protein